MINLTFTASALALFAIIAGLLRLLTKKIEAKGIAANQIVKQSVGKKSFWPIALLLLIVTMDIIFEYGINANINNKQNTYITAFFNSSILTILLWLFFRIKNEVIRQYNIHPDTTQSKKSATQALDKAITAFIVIAYLITLLSLLHIKITALLTIGGIGAAAFALASKDILSNFFGGLMIYLTSPFKSGDYITCQKGEISGVVEHIGWYTTIVRNLEKQPTYVPNSIFSGNFVTNISRMSHRKYVTTIGIRYNDIKQIDIIVNAIHAYISQLDHLDTKNNSYAYLSRYADSAIEITVGVYFAPVSIELYRELQHKVLKDLAKIVHDNNADFAYPTVTIVNKTAKD